MTAKTSEFLAQALEDAGLHGMAANARADMYHDYLSELDMPETELLAALTLAREDATDPILKARIDAVRERHLNGEFDASTEESDEWAASPGGQSVFRSLFTRKPKP